MRIVRAAGKMSASGRPLTREPALFGDLVQSLVDRTEDPMLLASMPKAMFSTGTDMELTVTMNKERLAIVPAVVMEHLIGWLGWAPTISVDLFSISRTEDRVSMNRFKRFKSGAAPAP